MDLTSGLPSSGGSQLALISRLETAYAKEKNPSKKALLKLQLKKLTTKGKVGKPRAGDAMAKYASIRSYRPKGNKDKSTLAQFAGTLADYSYKEPKEIDWEKEREKRSHQTVEEMYGLGSSASDPGGFMPYSYGWKHGGRIKKAKKKSKKSRPKGIRIALRGYGKAMGRG